jgi:hypothetical protein
MGVKWGLEKANVDSRGKREEKTRGNGVVIGRERGV